MVEADPDEERRAAERGDLPRLDLDRVRVRERRGESFHAHAVAADLLDQRLEVGRGRHDGQRAAAPRGSGGPAAARTETASSAARARPQHRGYFLAVKTDFGIMQCTPLRTSTTWLTRQSPTMDTSEYAS